MGNPDHSCRFRVFVFWMVFVLLATSPLGIIAPQISVGVERPLGEAYGRAGAFATFDGNRWLRLESQSLPLYAGASVKTTDGVSVVVFADGLRLELLPYGELALKNATEVELLRGRVIFRLPEQGRTMLVSRLARVEPVNQGSSPAAKIGEVLVDRDGIVGVKMLRGSVAVIEREGNVRHLLTASSAPLYLPRVPKAGGQLIMAQLIPRPARTLPPGATPTYDCDGKNIGYVLGDQYVAAPGVVPDLDRPVPDCLQAATLAGMPSGATAVVTASGQYVGYLLAGTFSAAAAVGGISAGTIIAVLAIAGVVGGGYALTQGGGEEGPPSPSPVATPTTP